jgi:hypothetical protein
MQCNAVWTLHGIISVTDVRVSKRIYPLGFYVHSTCTVRTAIQIVRRCRWSFTKSVTLFVDLTDLTRLRHRDAFVLCGASVAPSELAI